jgi:hypothetical protein
VARASSRIERLDEVVERQCLMVEPVKHRCRGAGHIFLERRVAVHATAQNDGIGKAADDALQLGHAAIGGRRTDKNVVLPRIPVEQNLPCRQEHDE